MPTATIHCDGSGCNTRSNWIVTMRRRGRRCDTTGWNPMLLLLLLLHVLLLLLLHVLLLLLLHVVLLLHIPLLKALLLLLLIVLRHRTGSSEA